jgi:hypothetical protein
LGRHEGAIRDDTWFAVFCELTKEAATETFMTNAGADRFDEQKESIGVALQAKLAKTKHMPASFAFFPEAVAGSGEEVHFTGTLRLFNSLGIQIAEHQHFASAMVLNDARYQSTEFFERQFHESLPKNKNPAGGTRQRVD